MGLAGEIKQYARMYFYIFWMLLAASLGFVKFIILAHILSVVDYGLYVAIFGISTFAGMVGSFGLLERTVKYYPRQWIEGRQMEMLVSAREIFYRLLHRFILVGIIATAITYIDNVPFTSGEVIMVCLLGLGSVLLSLLASLYRAVGSRRALQNFSLLRGCAAFVFAVSGSTYGFIGAISGEILASIVTGVCAFLVLRKQYAAAHKGLVSEDVSTAKNKIEKGHGSLYFANIFTALTSMGDRVFIGHFLGASAAGSYGFVMLIPQISQMMINIVAQYIGPLVIKIVHSRHQGRSHIGAIGLQAKIFSLLVVLFISGALWSRNLPSIDELFVKYSVSNFTLMFAGIMAIGQIYSLIQFHLIAHDGEHYVFAASLVSGILFILLFGIGVYQMRAIEYFVVVATFARWLQVSILTWALMRIKLNS